MALSIESCLLKLLASELISPAVYGRAKAAYQSAKNGFGKTMPPGDADVAAALEASRLMLENAQKNKAMEARSLLALNGNMKRVMDDPNSRVSGALGVLTPDIREAAHGPNVSSTIKNYEARLRSIAQPLIAPLNSKFGGLKVNHLGARKVMQEGFRDTGDAMAKQAWQAWQKTVEEGVKLMERAGGTFRSQAERDLWKFMQFWDSSRLRQISRAKDNGVDGSYFKSRIMSWIDRDQIDIVDKQTGLVTTVPKQREEIIEKAWKDIMINQSPGTMGTAFNDNVRVFRFKSDEAYLDLMDEFGIGKNGYYAAMMGHVHSMARKAALTAVLGPRYHANWRAIMQPVLLEEKKMSGAAQFGNPSRLFESAFLADNTFKTLTGEANSVQSELIAGASGALRNLATAAKLKNAIISAIPGDTVTNVLARKHVGMPAVSALKGIVTGIAGARKQKELARYLWINAHSTIDHLNAIARFGGIDADARFGRLANFTQLPLNWWTHLNQRQFSIDFMAQIAYHSDQALDEIKADNWPFWRFLTRHGLDRHWDQIRDAGNMTEFLGATYFHPAAFDKVNPEVNDHLLSAIMDERAYAILDQSERAQARLHGNSQRGTFWGDFVRRGGTQFKQFSMNILMTHGMRAATHGNAMQRTWQTGKFLALMTLAGAVAVQMRALFNGQDMRSPELSWDNKGFWLDAFATGGGAGFYGDIMKGQFDYRSQADLLGALGGPTAQLAADAAEIIRNNYGRVAEGKKTQFGKDFVEFARNWAPGTFYTNTIVNKAVFDQLQTMADPDYEKSWARQERRLRQRTGQSLYWGKGELLPNRPPRVSPPPR